MHQSPRFNNCVADKKLGESEVYKNIQKIEKLFKLDTINEY